MKVRDEYPEHKTVRQWARAGQLPKEGAEGVELWVNRFCQKSAVYYAPSEVEPADPERIKAYFAPERERRNQRARELREQERAERNRRKEYAAEYTAREQVRAAIMPCFELCCELYREKPVTPDRVLIIDTETTGLDPEHDEILQLSIIDGNGNELYNSYFNPCAHEWAAAERVNHISPADVQTAPRISAELPRIAAILSRAHKIIGYNLPFDLEFIQCCGVPVPADVETADVMRMFAPIYGEYSEYYEGYKWQKLTTAAAHYGYNWSEHGSAHDSRADCYATLYVHEKIMQSIYGDEPAPPVDDVQLTPSPGGRDCLGNGEHDGIEIQCDECAHYFECCDDQKEQKP
jgi:DNA polymerase-3 subunit epsilon